VLEFPQGPLARLFAVSELEVHGVRQSFAYTRLAFDGIQAAPIHMHVNYPAAS
jgi:hypothetical protein